MFWQAAGVTSNQPMGLKIRVETTQKSKADEMVESTPAGRSINRRTPNNPGNPSPWRGGPFDRGIWNRIAILSALTIWQLQPLPLWTAPAMVIIFIEL
jgi:hypothetical protein